MNPRDINSINKLEIKKFIYLKYFISLKPIVGEQIDKLPYFSWILLEIGLKHWEMVLWFFG